MGWRVLETLYQDVGEMSSLLTYLENIFIVREFSKVRCSPGYLNQSNGAERTSHHVWHLQSHPDHILDNSTVVIKEPEGSLDSSKMSPGTSAAVCSGFGSKCLCFLSRENKRLALFTAHHETRPPLQSILDSLYSRHCF